MNDKQKSMYTDKLQQIRAELMGAMGKTIKTSIEEESTQTNLHIDRPNEELSI